MNGNYESYVPSGNLTGDTVNLGQLQSPEITLRETDTVLNKVENYLKEASIGSPQLMAFSDYINIQGLTEELELGINHSNGSGDYPSLGSAMRVAELELAQYSVLVAQSFSRVENYLKYYNVSANLHNELKDAVSKDRLTLQDGTLVENKFHRKPEYRAAEIMEWQMEKALDAIEE